MSTLSGLSATIIDNECLTYGKTGMIEYFDHKIKMWKVSFDAPGPGGILEASLE